MRRKAPILTVILLVAALLTSCGTTVVAPDRMQFALEPSGNLGYEYDPASGFTFNERNLRFRSRAGESGLYLTGFEISFFDENGNQLGETSRQTLSLYVPGGFSCNEPDPVSGCSTFAEGIVPAPGPEVVTTESYQILDTSVAQMHVEESIATGYFPSGWYAEIVFTGNISDGREFQSLPYVLWISPPS